jgi:colanic acid/amylovoran biosynthesis glycosyltransferase
MRVAFIVNSFPKLSETFILNQICWFINKGIDVHIFAYNKSNENIHHPTVQIYKLMNRTSFWQRHNLFVFFLSLFRTIKYYNPLLNAVFRNRCFSNSRLQAIVNGTLFASKGPFDAILSHFGPNGTTAVELRNIGATNASILTFFHGYDVTKFLQKASYDPYTDLKINGDLFLAVSRKIYCKLQELGFPIQNIVLHRMGIDLNKFTYRSHRVPFKGKVVIVAIGRLVEKKGFEYGLRAFAELQTSDLQPILQIAGDGPLRTDLEKLAQYLGVEDSVEFLGWQPQENIQNLLANGQIFLAPSVTSKDGDQEGIPVTLMEAMASGLPVVATSHSGIPELVAHGETGWLAPERDVDSLRACLQEVLDHPERAYVIAENARTSVQEHHDVEKLNGELLGYIHSLAGRE